MKDNFDVQCGNCNNLIMNLEENSIDCIITSPPYWALRDEEMSDAFGSEKLPEQYIKNLVEFFELCKRPLREDGTLWLNLGDKHMTKNMKSLLQIKQKDLIGLPWSVALSLREKGWYLRSDIIWDKMNKCMPENVTDRFVKCHEYIFLLSQNSSYYFDWKAVRERGVIPAGTRAAKGSEERYRTKGVNSRPPKYKIYDGFRRHRSIIRAKPKPSRFKHYSTFPVELVIPCVLAGSRVGGTVLDPFCGTGTTGLAALMNGRKFIGFDINENYCTTTNNRLLEYSYAGRT